MPFTFVGSTASASAPLALGVQGSSFTVDGAPRFLVFVSYFDALDAAHSEWPESVAVGRARDAFHAWDDANNRVLDALVDALHRREHPS